MKYKSDLDTKMERLLRDPIWEKSNLAEIYAKQYTTELLDGLLEIWRDDTNPLTIRVKVALELLNRGWGKSAVAIRVTSDREKDNALQTIEGELFAAEETSRQIMELAKQGGNSQFWLEPTPKALQILGHGIPDSTEDAGQ
jgi:hypothetical protein